MKVRKEELFSIKITIRLLLILVFLTFSCAQKIQPLSGGPKDTLAPKIKFLFPQNFSTNFSSNKITVKFNEFFILQNVNQNTYISAYLSHPLKFTVKGKKLIISLPKLLDSTTYLILFKKAIADYNEKNPIDSFKLVFSTYDKIDSLQITGFLIDAYKLSKVKNVLVGLYKINQNPLYDKPKYIANVDTNGKFQFFAVKKDNYKIFAFNDINNNFLLDKEESYVAFIDTTITPTSKTIYYFDTIKVKKIINKDTITYDSVSLKKITSYLPDSLKLYFFEQTKPYQAINYIIRPFPNCIIIKFYNSIENNFFEANIDSFKSPIDFFALKTSKPDSLVIWLKNNLLINTDTVKIRLSYLNNKNIIDTIVAVAKKSLNSNTYLKPSLVSNKIFAKQNLSLYIPTFLKKIDTNLISIYRNIDTTVFDPKIQDCQCERISFDSIICYFKRPVINIPKLTFENNYNYSINLNSTKDSAYIKVFINEPKLDSLNFSIDFDNLYFFNQIQKLSKKFNLPIIPLKIKNISRKTPEKIEIYFTKKISINNIELIELSKVEKNKINIFTENNILKINLDQKNPPDTLFIKLKIKDFSAFQKSYFLEKDTFSIYTFDRQRIIKANRKEFGTIEITFYKNLIKIPQIQLLSSNSFSKWYSLTINSDKNIVYLTIVNNLVKRIKNLKIAVNYIDVNHHGDTLVIQDTLILPVVADTSKTIASPTINVQKMKLKEYKKFRIYYSDSIPQLINIKIENPNEGNYTIKMQKNALEDYNSLVNDTISFNFEIKNNEKSASIEFLLDKDYESNLIVELFNKNNLIDAKPLAKGEKIIFDNLIPEEYIIRLIYDTNNNGYWDRGNWEKNILPEKIIFYKKITLQNNQKYFEILK